MAADLIVFTEDQIRVIKQCAIRSFPSEACGLITGSISDNGRAIVKQVIEAKNILAAERQDRFEVDPATRIQVEKDCRLTGSQLIAHFHSHPSKPAIPSKTDLQWALEPTLIWIIAGMHDDLVSELKAYRMQGSEKSFVEIDRLVEAA